MKIYTIEIFKIAPAHIFPTYKAREINVLLINGRYITAFHLNHSIRRICVLLHVLSIQKNGKLYEQIELAKYSKLTMRDI